VYAYYTNNLILINEFQEKSIERSPRVHSGDRVQSPLSLSSSKRYWKDECALCKSVPLTVARSSQVQRTSRPSSSAAVSRETSHETSRETSDDAQRQNCIDSVVLLPCFHHVCLSCLSAAVTEELRQGTVLEHCPVRNVLIYRNAPLQPESFMQTTTRTT